MRRRSWGGVGRRRSERGGFTLLEIVVGVMLLAVVSAGSAVLISVANRMLGTSTTQNNAQAAIDSDISRARKLAEDYTCCPGSCTANAASISTATANGKCLGNANDSTYYFPQQAADVTTYVTACGNGTLNANLITAIQALGSLTNVTRTVANDDSSDPTANRLRITYTGTGGNAGLTRVVKLVPTVAAWCP